MSTALKFFASVLLVAVICGGVFVLYLKFFGVQEPVLPAEVPEQKNNQIFSPEVQETYEQSIALRMQGENGSAIEYLKSEQAKAENTVDAAWYTLAIASITVAKEPQIGLQSFSDLYNDASLPEALRGEALYGGMLYASKIQKPSFTVAQAKEWIFSPDAFGSAVEITNSNYQNIQTTEDVMSLAIAGFALAEKMVVSERKDIRIITERAVLQVELAMQTAFNASDSGTSTDARVDQMRKQIRNTPELDGQLREIRRTMRDTQDRISKRIGGENPEYNSDYLYALGYIQRVYTELFYLGYDANPDILSVRGQLQTYVKNHQNNNTYPKERTALISATSDMRFACSETLSNRYDLKKININTIKSYLQGMYAMNDEAVAVHGAPLEAIASRTHVACYKPFVFIGNSIDPQFKKFLIERIGGWSDANFNIQ
jgi:hypothetical protein